MYVILSVLLVGCAGSTDSVQIGHGTGEFRNWDRAKCWCNAWTNELTEDRKVFTAMLTCTPHRNGHRFAGLLTIGSSAADGGMVPNTVTQMTVSANGYVGAATAEFSSDVDMDDDGVPWMTVWIDDLAVPPGETCTTTVESHYDYDITTETCTSFEGGTLEDVRMTCPPLVF